MKIGGVGLAQHLDQGAWGQKGSDLLTDPSGFGRLYSRISKVHDIEMRKEWGEEYAECSHVHAS